MFAKKGMFVKNSKTIQKMADIDEIVFDKTGTLSESHHQHVVINNFSATEDDIQLVLSVLSHSTHPLSKTIIKTFPNFKASTIQQVKEVMGNGIEAWHNDLYIKAGKAEYVGVLEDFQQKGSSIYFSIDGKRNGSFWVSNSLKSGVDVMIQNLKPFKLNLLSGDNEFAASQMEQLFPVGSLLKFRQNPQQKLDFIKSLQSKNQSVLMIGDGINDAGALKQSNVGISVVENSFSFSPASDAILSGTKVVDLYRFLKASAQVKRLIIGTFIYSLIYNTIGISIAVSAHMKPVVAAILMPASSISVILIAFVGTYWIMRNNFKK
jgi:Cu+-exporting ATPase